MPLASEVLINRPLSGPELLEVILEDARDLLAKDGMFAERMGYGRVGYMIRVELELDNLTYPKHATMRKGGEGLPLPAPSAGAVAVDLARSRQIVSPNATRILNDLPITVTSAVGGKLVTREISGYAKEDVPPQPEAQDLDRSEAAYAALKPRMVKGD